MLQLEIMAAVENADSLLPGTEHKNGLTLLVTSSVPEEGKSVAAANLAISMAQTGRKVLLVDADCRNPLQHKLLELDAQMGLADVLAGNAAWDDVVRSTSVDNLYAITSGVDYVASLSEGENGERDASALLISSRFDDFLKLSRDQFGVIIFDSPPATLASESVAISSKVDGVLLVIKANDTKKDVILRAKRNMQNSGGNILGALLNFAVP
jgi:capsular exopolysaccharide synthesis family protein